MKIGIIGCGFVADFYLQTASNHSSIEIKSVFDIDAERLKKFCDYYSLSSQDSIESILQDSEIDMVFNLTNPKNHFNISKMALEHGKHVYSEKPLGMNYEEAHKLVSLADELGLYIGSAPCSFLSNTAKSTKMYLDNDLIGDVKLVYVAYETPMTHMQSYDGWVSPSGAKWPAKDEFEIGCTYEHAGYFLTWLAMFFGSAMSVSAYSSCQIKNKGIQLDYNAPDFTLGCIEYKNGVLARVTSSILAPTDKSMTIIGEKGTLYIKNIRDDNSPIYHSDVVGSKIFNAIEYRVDFYSEKFERFFNWIPWSWGNYFRLRKSLPLLESNKKKKTANALKPVDFCLGPAELIDAINKGEKPLISSELALHITEITEILQYPKNNFDSNLIKSSID